MSWQLRRVETFYASGTGFAWWSTRSLQEGGMNLVPRTPLAYLPDQPIPLSHEAVIYAGISWIGRWWALTSPSWESNTTRFLQWAHYFVIPGALDRTRRAILLSGGHACAGWNGVFGGDCRGDGKWGSWLWRWSWEDEVVEGSRVCSRGFPAMIFSARKTFIFVSGDLGRWWVPRGSGTFIDRMRRRENENENVSGERYWKLEKDFCTNWIHREKDSLGDAQTDS